MFFLNLCDSCAFRLIDRHKGIVFFNADSAAGIPRQKLNIFSPQKPQSKNIVLVFIHGGNWNSGNRSLYSFFGSRWARKGVVTVVTDYPLSPDATFKEMAIVSATAIKWVKENIATYGGDPEQIFVSGHSAGGHLAALISVDKTYFDSLHITNPIKGTILIDAAGLDMYNYLKQEHFPPGHTYLNTFTTDQMEWKKASPVSFLHPGLPPFLVFLGGKTYPSIKKSNAVFKSQLLPIAPDTRFEVIKGRHHIPMITQFFNPWNDCYDTILQFMEK